MHTEVFQNTGNNKPRQPTSETAAPLESVFSQLVPIFQRFLNDILNNASFSELNSIEFVEDYFY